MKLSLVASLPVLGLLAVQTLAAPAPLAAPVEEKSIERRQFGTYLATLQKLYGNIKTYTAVINTTVASVPVGATDSVKAAASSKVNAAVVQITSLLTAAKAEVAGVAGGLPAVPGLPGVPGLPAVPGLPGVPALPAAPGLPTVPGLPLGGTPSGKADVTVATRRTIPVGELQARQTDAAAIVDLIGLILLEISGTLNYVIAVLGLTSLLSVLQPLVLGLSALILSLELVIDGLLLLIGTLLSGILTGLSVALAGLVL